MLFWPLSMHGVSCRCLMTTRILDQNFAQADGENRHARRRLQHYPPPQGHCCDRLPGGLGLAIRVRLVQVSISAETMLFSKPFASLLAPRQCVTLMPTAKPGLT